MQVKRDELQAALRRVLPCVAGRDSRVEVYKCVRFHEGRLFTFDGNFGAVTASGIPDTFSAGVNAENLASVLNAMPDEFTMEKGQDLLLKGGKSKAKLPLLPDDQDWPEFLGEDQTEILSAENFYEALESAFFCLDSQSAKMSYAPTVLIRESFLYTTDGRRGCRVKLDKPAVRTVKIPMDFAKLILKAGKPDLLFEGNGIGVLYADTATIYVGREVACPDYGHRLDDAFDGSGKGFQMPDWKEALKAAGSLAVSKDDRVFVEIENGQARFAWQGDRGHVEQFADAPGGESFHCNMRYLNQALEHNPTEIDFGFMPNTLRFSKPGWSLLTALHG